MKLIAWILCLSFTMNVFAASGLSEAVDEYNYALNVEWDQSDRGYYDAQTKLFFARISELRDQGLTQKDVNAYVAGKLSDKVLLGELAFFAQNAQSVDDLMDILKTHSDSLYARGANWNGSSVLRVGAIAAVSALFVYSIYFTIKYGGCIETTNGMNKPCNEN